MRTRMISINGKDLGGLTLLSFLFWSPIDILWWRIWPWTLLLHPLFPGFGCGFWCYPQDVFPAWFADIGFLSRMVD